MNERKNIYLILVLLSLISKIIGFARESVLAFFFGAGGVVDAFKLSESLSGIILGGLAAIPAIFVPLYMKIKGEKGEQIAKEYLKQLIIVAFIIAGILGLLSLLCTSQFIIIGAPGFDDNKRKVASNMYGICVVGYLFYAQIGIFNNYLNCEKKFIRASFSTLFVGSTQIVFIVLAYYLNNGLIIALGLSLSMIVRYLYLRISSHVGCLVRLHTGLPVLTKELEKSIVMALPLFVTEIVVDINEMIDNSFASSLSNGMVSILGYAGTLSMAFYTLITGSILTVFFTSVSEKIANKDKKGEVKELEYTTSLIIKIIIPFCVMAILFSQWGINLLYERGAFSHKTTIQTAIAFSIYITGLPALAFRSMSIQYYQAQKKTGLPLVISLANIAVNVCLDYFLIKSYGYIGLAMATTISYYFLLLIEVIMIKRLCKDYLVHDKILLVGKVVLSLLPSIALALTFMKLFNGFYINSTFLMKIVCLCIIAALTIALYAVSGQRFKIIDTKSIAIRMFDKIRSLKN